MKKFLLFLSVLFWYLCGYAQVKTYDVDLSAVVDKKYEGLEEGTTIRISKLVSETVIDTSPELEAQYKTSYYMEVDGLLIPITSKIEKRLHFMYETVQDVWNAKIISKVLPVIAKKGGQRDLRFDMEQDALEYMDRVNVEGLVYYDPYLENYIYSLIAKIVPKRALAGRHVDVKLIILNDNSLNMGIFPNGLLMVTTGLLSCLHSEDELVAVLSHEIAHLALDHHIQNVNKAISRKSRAEFWSAVLTGATAVAEGIAAAKSDYVPGLATMGMAMVSSSIFAQVIDRLGMEYNHEQEIEADNISRRVLSVLQYNPNALATALSNIKTEMENRGSDEAYFESYTHPALIERIQLLGGPQFIEDPDFEKKISFVITNIAQYRYEIGHFREAIDLVNQNMENGVAVSEDYMLKAHSLLALYDDEMSNQDALALIHRAKELAPSDINIYKFEILAYLRLGDKATARRLLQEYDAILRSVPDCSVSNLVNSEMIWSRDMQIKLDGGM